MSKYEYIIFDLDGTLIDPKIGQINSVDYALKSFDIYEFNKEILSRFIGLPLKESFAKYYNFNEEQIEKGIKKYREYFINKGIEQAEIYDGVLEMLQELNKNNLKVIMATSNPTLFARKIAKTYRIEKYFYDICGSNMDGSRVLKQEIIAYAIKRNNIKELEKVVMVGDRLHDIVGAKENKIDSIGILYGYGSEKEINDAKPNYYVKTVEDLKVLLIDNIY